MMALCLFIICSPFGDSVLKAATKLFDISKPSKRHQFRAGNRAQFNTFKCGGPLQHSEIANDPYICITPSLQCKLYIMKNFVNLPNRIWALEPTIEASFTDQASRSSSFPCYAPKCLHMSNPLDYVFAIKWNWNDKLLSLSHPCCDCVHPPNKMQTYTTCIRCHENFRRGYSNTSIHEHTWHQIE